MVYRLWLWGLLCFCGVSLGGAQPAEQEESLQALIEEVEEVLEEIETRQAQVQVLLNQQPGDPEAAQWQEELARLERERKVLSEIFEHLWEELEETKEPQVHKVMERRQPFERNIEQQEKKEEYQRAIRE